MLRRGGRDRHQRPRGARTAGPRRKGDLPAVRVFSLGKEQGAGRSAQAARLGRALARTAPGAGAVFVHMVPRLAILAYPFAAFARRPLALWYAQRGVDRSLRLASRLADYLLTPTRDSFPLAGGGRAPSARHRARDRHLALRAGRDTPARPPRFLAAGRASPSKRYDRLLDAVALMKAREWRLRIAGPPLLLGRSPRRDVTRAGRDSGPRGAGGLPGSGALRVDAGGVPRGLGAGHTSATGTRSSWRRWPAGRRSSPPPRPPHGVRVSGRRPVVPGRPTGGDRLRPRPGPGLGPGAARRGGGPGAAVVQREHSLEVGPARRRAAEIQ